MANKVFHAMFDDEEKLKSAAEVIVAKGVKVKEVFSPFPIHGIDPIIGVKQTRLAITSFIYGMIGIALALIGIRYMNITDWPMNIGGKPSFSFTENIPAFIPVIFEFGVLCAAHGMVITYLLRNGTLPGVPASNPDPRTTDDMFVMEITTEDNDSFQTEDIASMIKEADIVELSVKDY